MKRDLKPSEIVIRDEILRRLEEGESLRGICRTEGFPSPSAVLAWTKDETEEGGFGEQYARARQIGYTLLAEEIVAISDEAEVEAIYKGDSVTLDLSNTAVARNRLRVDTRKWMLSKMLPKVYGDKVAHEVSGVDGKPIQTENTSVVVPLDPVEASRVYLKTMEGRKE